MKWLKALIKRFKDSTRLYPECLWQVAVDESGFRATDHTGVTASVRREDLTSVCIETNDSGPWGADVWVTFYGADGQLACAFPQGSVGEKDVLDALLALPDFDNKAMIKAMGCTSNAKFVVWRR